MTENSQHPSPGDNRTRGYWLACVLLLVSIGLYATSLTMNVARAKSEIAINQEGVDKVVDKMTGEMVEEADKKIKEAIDETGEQMFKQMVIEGVQIIKTELGNKVPFDKVADEIGDLIREYVYKMKREVPGFIANEIDIGDVRRAMNKEVKKRGAGMMNNMMPEIDIEESNIKMPDNIKMPEIKLPDIEMPQLSVTEPERDIMLLRTIKELYQGTKNPQGKVTSPPDPFLATCILLFTIFFPISKYCALGWILMSASRGKERVLNWLKNWGQWSMGDVFVVAFMVTFLKINSSIISSSEIAEIKVRVDVLPGMYLFTAAIILGMIATMLITRYVQATAPVAIGTTQPDAETSDK
tara:strand:+ start:241 stop:1302 length:1062 start_codon:yes stop_codon:yes gene_type:complete